jgi:phospholipase/carboxylesterase|tara:strand:- start:1066 stop:1713 length:648 start_codon:yes stop_codon:yes gene_type:complete
MSILTGPIVEPLTKENPKQLVIFCHGYGADGNDLIGLSSYFQPILPDAIFLSPNAPQKCALNPFGYQWFDFQSGDPALIWKGVLEAAIILNSFIDEQLEKYNLSDDNLALIGFSQGTMMSLHVGLRRGKPMRAIVGFSGKLIGEEFLQDDLVSRPPVYLIHGEQDSMIPHQETINAAKVLEGHNIEVQRHLSPNTPHSIAEDGLKIAIDFISNKF